MRRTGRFAGAIAGLAWMVTALGSGGAALASGSPYYDIQRLTPLAQRAIVGLYQAGIMNGTAPGKFSPYGVVTRAQAVKFVVNLVGLSLVYPRTPDYADVGKGSQYYPYIETALKDGILSGYAPSSGNFNPSVPVTRIQLAVLEVNALGEQALAQSLASDTTLYPRLVDMSQVPPGYLGYANAGMKLGLVPPLNATHYAPAGQVDREQLAVGLWRALGQLKASAPATLRIEQSAATVGVGQVDSLTVTVLNRAGQVIPAAALASYSVAFSVTGNNASSASVSQAGQFVASAAGTYTVQASLSGGVLPAPITATATVGVYGAPVALEVKPAAGTVVADGVATDTVTVSVVDANGLVVSDYNGTVTVSDSSNPSLLALAVAAKDEPADLTVGPPDTLTLSGGVGTFTVGATQAVGITDTITATSAALTAGSATVTTVAPTVGALALSVESGQPSSLSANTQTSTQVAVTLEDAAGNPLTSGAAQYVTLTLTGPGSFQAGTTPVTTYTVFDAGVAYVPVYSEPGQPGSIVVNARTTTGLTASPLTIDAYINTTPAGLSVTATSGQDTAGNTYEEYTVSVVDTNGHPIANATGAVTVTDNAAVGGGALVYSTSGQAPFTAASPFTVSLGTNGVATFYVETKTVGTGTVTLTVTGDSPGSTAGLSTTATYAYAAGKATSVELEPSASVYKVIGGTTFTIAAQVVDGNGNPVAAAGQYVTFTIPANAAGVTLPNGLITETVTTGTTGVATLSLTIPNPPSASEVFTVGASLGTTISGSGQRQETITVVPSTNTTDYATGLVASPSTVTATAGSPLSTVTVTATNAAGGAVPGDVLTVTSSNSAVVNVPSGFTTTSGSTLGNLTAGMAGTAVLTVTDISDPAQPKAQVTVTVYPGSTAVQEVVEYNNAPISASNPVNVAANTPIQLAVVNADSAGDPIPVTGASPLTVDLSVASGVSGGFLSGPGGAPVSQVQIQPGQASAVVYFESPTAETLSAGDLLATAVLSPPTNLTASEVSTGIALSWTAPSGAQPASYQVLEEAAGASGYRTVSSAYNGVTSGNVTGTVITGLTPGVAYTFEVEAIVSGVASAPSSPSTAVEYGAKATGVTASAFTAAQSGTAGSVTLTVAYDKPLPSQTPDTTAADYTVTDATHSLPLTVNSVSVAGGELVLSVSIPAGDTQVAASDTVDVSTAKSVAVDGASAPTAPIAVSGTL
jgi:hypothetical protein